MTNQDARRAGVAVYERARKRQEARAGRLWSGQTAEPEVPIERTVLADLILRQRHDKPTA
jgi:hypothetical protein